MEQHFVVRYSIMVTLRPAKPINLVQTIENKEARNPGEDHDANRKTDQSYSGD